jgi:hypothetical protein
MKYVIIITFFTLGALGCHKPDSPGSFAEITDEQQALADGRKLVNRLGERDSIVVLQIDSMKSAKVAIYNCTVASTVYGIEPPSKIVLSFLHFPNCRRLSVGRRYLCAIRHGSGTGYELIRSDMLNTNDKLAMYNCFWMADSQNANQVVAGITSE